ncbi:C-type lectin domain family 4 member G [Gorilla gorilla gorilla]|uniref:C-type lectin domain family 4 member G n=1 Tax=Gorilla gorilla gorilla TaxID=9595 RepID=UPI002445CB4B|nr:C-type lectin domain family 4 member G [Gorilla gorilla gorilla]
MIEGRDASSKDPKELSALGPKLPPRLGETVTPGLADTGHDRDFIWDEMFRQIKVVQARNEFSCPPCPKSWKAFQGSCYSFFSDNLTWPQANDSCAQNQAHLVIINSRAEQVGNGKDFLTSTNQATSWIGLFKGGQGSAHRWMDGSAPTYINWDSRKLDDNGTTPACVMMLYQGH